MDNGRLNGVIFLDLKKAFDCVDHNILLKKLQLYGASPCTVKWFKSYLSNRIQMCKIKQTLSERHTMRCGVPQGSNLGPLLFLVYINDLPGCLSHSTTSMFADDTNFTTSGSSSEEVITKLNVDLDKVHKWLIANRLTLNKEKTEYMIIRSRQKLVKFENEQELKLGDYNIHKVKHTKALGVIVDEQLSWKNQTESIANKASKGIGMLRRIRKFVPRSVLENVYKAIVLPYFDYCSLVWDNCSMFMQEKLQKNAKQGSKSDYR